MSKKTDIFLFPTGEMQENLQGEYWDRGSSVLDDYVSDIDSLLQTAVSLLCAGWLCVRYRYCYLCICNISTKSKGDCLENKIAKYESVWPIIWLKSLK